MEHGGIFMRLGALFFFSGCFGAAFIPDGTCSYFFKAAHVIFPPTVDICVNRHPEIATSELLSLL
jgi:hypothetical protein